MVQPYVNKTRGGFLHVAGYPDSFVTSADPSSLGMFHGVPRLLMGMLAVLDTFLTYRIAEGRFGRRAAVIAAGPGQAIMAKHGPHRGRLRGRAAGAPRV